MITDQHSMRRAFDRTLIILAALLILAMILPRMQGQSFPTKYRKQWRVCWIGPYTHDEYCGSPFLKKQVARKWARVENKEYPHIRHFVRIVRRTDVQSGPTRTGDVFQSRPSHPMIMDGTKVEPSSEWIAK